MSRHHYQIGTPNHSGPKTVVIVGAPRGGTSMVAGTVRELGIDLGSRLGRNHEDPKFLPKDVDQIRAVIKARTAEADTWGWKMPHSLGYIDEIEGDLRNPHIIFVWRNMLATTLSQVERSSPENNPGTTPEDLFLKCLRFSQNRLTEMTDKIPKLKSPLLLVDYDRATRHKEDFVDALAGFLGVTPDDAMRQRCYDFIDPQTGYKQVAETFYQVQDADPFAHPDVLPCGRRAKNLKRNEADRTLEATGPNPNLTFAIGETETFPADFILRLKNPTGRKTAARLMFDFDGHFSHNMALEVTAKPGPNAYRIVTNGNLRRLALVPTITDGKSDLVYIELRKA